MKRSLRLPLALISFLAAYALLSLYPAVRRQTFFAAAPDPAPDATLLPIAALDPYESEILRDVADLLNGNLPASASRTRSRSAAWRRENYLLGDHQPRRRRRRTGHGEPWDPDFRSDPLRLRSPKDLLFLRPEFRRMVRDWHRRRQLFQPPSMLDLAAQLAEDGRRFGRCAVVGNSGILLRAEHGAAIDAHDVVIRLNNARVAGFERHVGSKTNLSFANSNIVHLCGRRGGSRGCLCHPYGDRVPLLVYICQAAHLLDVAACNATAAAAGRAPLLVTDPRLDVLVARIAKYYSVRRFVAETGRGAAAWAGAHDERMFHYSSGMEAVVVAAGVCERVSVYGFGKDREAKHHYHTNQKAELDLHDYEAEYEFYRDLEAAKRRGAKAIPFLADAGFAVPPVVFYH